MKWPSGEATVEHVTELINLQLWVIFVANSSSNTWNFIGILPDSTEAIYWKSITHYPTANNKEICTNSRIQRSLQSSQQLSQLGAQKLDFLAVFRNKMIFSRTFLPKFNAKVMKFLSIPILKEIGRKSSIWNNPAVKVSRD